MTAKSTPLPFAADVPVDATLLDGAIVDLNVMTRRSSFTHNVQRLVGSYSAEAKVGTRLVLALDPVTISVNNELVRLDKLDGIFMENNMPFTIEAGHDESTFFLITLQPT